MSTLLPQGIIKRALYVSWKPIICLILCQFLVVGVVSVCALHYGIIMANLSKEALLVKIILSSLEIIMHVVVAERVSSVFTSIIRSKARYLFGTELSYYEPYHRERLVDGYLDPNCGSAVTPDCGIGRYINGVIDSMRVLIVAVIDCAGLIIITIFSDPKNAVTHISYAVVIFGLACTFTAMINNKIKPQLDALDKKRIELNELHRAECIRATIVGDSSPKTLSIDYLLSKLHFKGNFISTLTYAPLVVAMGVLEFSSGYTSDYDYESVTSISRFVCMVGWHFLRCITMISRIRCDNGDLIEKLEELSKYRSTGNVTAKIGNLIINQIKYRTSDGILRLSRDNVLTLSNGLTFICGKSGSGKTTFLRLFTSQLDAEGLNVDVSGLDAISSRDIMASLNVGVVSRQQTRTTLIPKKPVNLGEWLGVEPNDDFAIQILEDLQLSGKHDTISLDKTIPSTLSGGESARLEMVKFIISTVNLEPRMVLLDEIDSGMDTKTSKIVFATIEKYFPKSVILAITHDDRLINKAHKVGRNVLRINNGVIM